MDPGAGEQDAQPVCHLGLLRSPGNSSLRLEGLLEGSAINTFENVNRRGAVGGWRGARGSLSLSLPLDDRYRQATNNSQERELAVRSTFYARGLG